MARADETFKQALIGKKIPILTLDNKWHKLITKSEFSSELQGMEMQLNDLLKRQAKVHSESKEVKKLKKKLMEDVVLLADAMGEHPTKKQEKSMEEHKRLIEECNEKMDAYEEEMADFIRKNDIDIAVLTIPKTSAVEVAEQLAACHIKGIWNFAHIDLHVPPHIQVENVHLSDSLMKLSYNLTSSENES